VDPLEHLHVADHEGVDVGERELAGLQAAVDRLADQLRDRDVEPPRRVVRLAAGDHRRPAHPDSSSTT
jgi:hypothetical protein